MKIQINTDNNGREKLAKQAEAMVESTLGHLEKHLTCVKVHLSEKNSNKVWTHDKRCMMEARIEHQRHHLPPDVCFGGRPLDK